MTEHENDDELAAEAASDYKRQVDRNGKLKLRPADLMSGFGVTESSSETRGRIADALWTAGILTEPSVGGEAVTADTWISLAPAQKTDDQYSTARVVGGVEWRQAPDGAWWFRGPGTNWYASDASPDDAHTIPAVPTFRTGPGGERFYTASESAMTSGAWLAMFAGVLAVISAFLPWVHLSAVVVNVDRNSFQLGQNESFSLTGLIVLLLGVVTAVIGVTKLTRSAARRFMQRSPVITGIALAAVSLLQISPIHGLIRRVENTSSLATGSVEFELWLAVISGVGAVGAGLILRSHPA